MRWLCDEMLGRLARLLRAAGEDVVLAPSGASDDTLLSLAADEGRRIVTRDRSLAGRAGETALLLRADDTMRQAEENAVSEPVDWRSRRFTRCLIDNAPLRAASADELACAPESARSGPGPFRTCPRCGRLYWPGSHVKRLNERLDRLAIVAESVRAPSSPGRPPGRPAAGSR